MLRQRALLSPFTPPNSSGLVSEYDIDVILDDNHTIARLDEMLPRPITAVNRHILQGFVVSNRRLTRVSWAQDVRHIVFQYSNDNIMLDDGGSMVQSLRPPPYFHVNLLVSGFRV
jgi:hypothetical protein